MEEYRTWLRGGNHSILRGTDRPSRIFITRYYVYVGGIADGKKIYILISESLPGSKPLLLP